MERGQVEGRRFFFLAAGSVWGVDFFEEGLNEGVRILVELLLHPLQDAGGGAMFVVGLFAKAGCSR